MILELDLGNTRAKWRILNSHSDIIARGIDDIAVWIDGDFPAVWSTGIRRMRIASVVSPAIERQLASKIQSVFSLLPEIARPSLHCAGITNAYVEPERLGVDRWLALIAAYRKLESAVMVIDVGTALKVDVADSAGRHLGGYIIPGPALMEHALFDGTDRVRFEGGLELGKIALGVDTRTCVQHGIAAALTGAVLVAIDQCRSVIGASPICVTGGFGLQIRGCLEAVGVKDLCYEPDLVLDGLRWVLP
ncbi:MAG: type III pantothenate kinase [Spongiibacteraceae bacterium]